MTRPAKRTAVAFADPGYILHTDGGRYFYYLAHRGVPFGQRHGPFADPERIPERAHRLRRLIAFHADGRARRRAAQACERTDALPP